MNRILLILLVFSSFHAVAQEELTLKKCYDLVNTNYPLTKQKALLSKKYELDASAIKKATLPTLKISAQATYQSDVTEVPINSEFISIAPPNKDQYKTTLSLNQLIYNGGLVKTTLAAKSYEIKTQQTQLEVNLYQLKKRINHLYFSILLLQEKKHLLESKKSKLNAKIKEVRAAIDYGVLLPSTINVLSAELLIIEQSLVEADQNKLSLITTLSQVLGEPIQPTIILNNQDIQVNPNQDLKRPELELFQLQKQQIESSEQLINKSITPKLFGFATSGYGNPGLNFLDNTFQPYYLVGVKFDWNVFDWNITKKKRMSLAISKDIVDNQLEVFQLNTNIELQQIQSEIDKITTFIVSDKTIIDLREKILNSADAQLNNGMITPSEYTTELTHLFEAKTNLKVHKIQLLLSKANYQTIRGN